MASNVTISRAIRRLDQVKDKKERVHYLTKNIPYVFGTVDDDCRMAVEQYLHIVEGEYWRDVSDTPEEYFAKYCKHPVEWFNTLAEGIALLDQSKPIPAQDALDAVELKNTKRPDNLRQKSPETIEKAKRAQQLRAEGWTQQAIADKLGVSQQYVAETLLTTDTSYNITSVGCKRKDTNPSRPASRGTSREYLEALIRRDFPEVAAKVDSGEIRSWNKAAIVCGIVKEKITIQFPPEETGSQIAGRLYQKLRKEQLIELRDELNNYPLEDCHG